MPLFDNKELELELELALDIVLTLMNLKLKLKLKFELELELYFSENFRPDFLTFLSFSYGRSFDIVKLNEVKSHKRNNCCMLSCIGVK